MTVRIDDEYVTGSELYATRLHGYSDGDYSLHQTDRPGVSLGGVGTHDVYLNKQQAIKYAKAILRNEGIHAID